MWKCPFLRLIIPSAKFSMLCCPCWLHEHSCNVCTLKPSWMSSHPHRSNVNVDMDWAGVSRYSREIIFKEVASPDPDRRSDPIGSSIFHLVDYFINSLRYPLLRGDMIRRRQVTLKEAFEELNASENILVRRGRLLGVSSEGRTPLQLSHGYKSDIKLIWSWLTQTNCKQIMPEIAVR